MEHHREPTEAEWRDLARQALKEQAPEKMVALAQQIIEAYDGQIRKKPGAEKKKPSVPVGANRTQERSNSL
jgi:plasmid stability protein